MLVLLGSAAFNYNMTKSDDLVLMLNKCPIKDIDIYCTDIADLRHLKPLVRHLTPINDTYMIGVSSDIFNSDMVVEVTFLNKEDHHYKLFEMATKHGHMQTSILDIHKKQSISVPNNNILLATKMAHRFKDSPHFHKTMADISQLRYYGARVPTYLKKWVVEYQRYVLRDQPHPKLNVSKEDFFESSHIDYIYDHDDLHMAIVGDDVYPAYLYFISDNRQVQCSKKEFLILPDSIKLRSVAEEAHVLALERSIIPHPGKLSGYDAYIKALSKVCTRITSGWFREYAWEHYYIVRDMYDPEYISKFNKALADGTIRKYRSRLSESVESGNIHRI